MPSPRLFFALLLCWITIFTSHVSSYPTDGTKPSPDELQISLETRSSVSIEEFAHPDINSTLEERGLLACFTSLCCFGQRPKTPSDPPNAPVEMAWLCSDNWPTLDSLKSKIQDYGNVGTQISFFYTGFGGGGAQKLAGQWGNCHTNWVPNPPGFVSWDDVVDLPWYAAQVQALNQIFNRQIDPFQKLLSQAFAETSVGDVYLFTPEDYDPNARGNPISAWAGWEYPALTRNPNVGTIYRVDPRDGYDNDRKVFWTQAMGPSPIAPLGLNGAPDPPS